MSTSTAPPPNSPPPPDTNTAASMDAQLNPTPQTTNLPGAQSNPTVSMPKESWGRSVYHGVLNALGGANDVSLQRDPQTGQMIATSVKSGPGQQWKRIISGALTGYAAAAATGAHGPGSTSAKMGAGFQAAQGQVEKQYAQKRQEANEDFETMQKTATSNAQNYILGIRGAQAYYDLTRSKVKAGQEDIAAESQFFNSLASGGQGSTDLGSFATSEEAAKYVNSNPELHNELVNGKIAILPHFGEDGTYQGVHAALVTKQWLDAYVQQPLTVTRDIYENGKHTYKQEEIPPGVLTGDHYLKMASQESTNNANRYQAEEKDKQEKERLRLEGQRTGAEVATARANVGKTEAETDLTRYELDYLKRTGSLPGKAGSQEEQEDEWGPGGYVKGFRPWHKEMVEPAQAVESSYKVATDAYNDYKLAASQGKRLPTGAESMMLLSKHMQTTFGQVKGGRLTQAMIEEHMGARGLTDNMVTAVNKLYNGDALSPAQWEAFYQMIGQTRDATWQNVITDAKAQGRPLDKVNVPADMMQKYGQKPAPGAAPAAAPAAQAGGGGAPPAQRPGAPPELPDAALQQVKAAMGKPVTFGNGQVWQLNQAGQVVQVK